MDQAEAFGPVGGPHRLYVAKLQYGIHSEVHGPRKLGSRVLGKYELVVIPYASYFTNVAGLNLGRVHGYVLQGVSGRIFAAESYDEYKREKSMNHRASFTAGGSWCLSILNELALFWEVFDDS